LRSPYVKFILVFCDFSGAVRSQARWFCTYQYEYEDELDPIPDDGLTPLVWADDRTALTWADDGTTALMWASWNGHAPCIDALLKHSPKEQVLSACCVSGTTALMCASASGHAPCIYALLTHCPKEQVLATDKRGMTALTIACTEGDVPCIDALLQHHPKEQPLDAALKLLAIRYKADPTDVLQGCCERLLALGAVIVDRKTGEALRPITTDVAQRARIPHLINEAVVTALAHSGGWWEQQEGPREFRLTDSLFYNVALCPQDPDAVGHCGKTGHHVERGHVREPL
jgi:hypothetical protein